MVLFVGVHLQWPRIDHFFAGRVGKAAIAKRNDTDDDENDADDAGRFHWCELTMGGGLGSN